MDGYDDRWVDAGAIQTLKLIASARSLQDAPGVQQHNLYRARSIARAIEYVESVGRQLIWNPERIEVSIG